MSPCAVAVVSFNTRDLLRGLLQSVRSEAPVETVVVDNGSTDGTAEMIRHEFPEVRLIVDASNPGYGAAANQGVAATSAPYVLLLNGDTRLSPGALAALADHLDRHPRAGLAGPRLVDAAGRPQPSCFPFLGTFQLALEKSPLGPWLARLPALRDRWLVLHGPHDRPRTAPWVLGSALALRRQAFEEVGGFDSGFFMYAEEVDLCYRLWQAGWEVGFTPAATVVHVGGASTAPLRGAMAVRRVESARRFYRRHYSPARVAVLEAAIRTAMGARLVRDRLRLALARDDRDRARLAADVAVWHEALHR
jgi:hypothetical protein